MTKILIRGKQLRKVSLLVFIATVIVAIIIGLSPKVYSASGPGFFIFGDEDRSAELINKVANRQYQFNTSTTITYDKNTIIQDPTTARIYAADAGNHEIRIFDLNGKLIGELNDDDTLLDPHLGTRPGGLFSAEHTAAGNNSVYVNSLISNRITVFRYDELVP